MADGESDPLPEAHAERQVDPTLTVEPTSPDDPHRRLMPDHDLAAILSHVETRQVKGDLTSI